MTSTAPKTGTLSTGNYVVETSDGPSPIYKIDKQGNKIWVASASDPQVAMEIIEGLILVEYKRFYYPESTPSITVETETPEKGD